MRKHHNAPHKSAPIPFIPCFKITNLEEVVAIQVQATDAIQNNILSIRQLVGETTSGVDQLLEDGEHMNHISRDLAQLVSGYKVVH